MQFKGPLYEICKLRIIFYNLSITQHLCTFTFSQIKFV